MQLKDFIEQQKQLLDDFALQYDRTRKSKQLTLFRPNHEWRELLAEYEDSYGDQESTQTNKRRSA